MGELAHEVKQLAEAGPVDLHGGVDAVQADAVLVVVHIGGVLQKPGGAVDGDGNDPVVLPGGMVHPAGVALVLGAQHAPRVGGGGQVPGGGDGLGVLLRLGQVDGDVQLPILRGGLPLHVLGDPVPADIVGVLAEFTVPVGGFPGILPAEGLEFFDHLGGPGGEPAHELGVEQIPVDHGVLLQHPPLMGVIQEGLQHRGQLHRLVPGLRAGKAVQLQGVQNGVDGPGGLAGLNEPGMQGVGDQLGNGFIPLHGQPSSNPWGWSLCHTRSRVSPARQRPSGRRR